MQKLISRACCLCLVVLVMAACLPFSAFAVDPVSAGVMANAFAQAIAAYGASNGVALTFDVANTDGIGESVHELWKDFRDGTQSVDDYATLAAALFPDLYYKASSAVAGAADVYTVGYNISSTYAEEFDNFFNWLLSGPAEMVKVDNEYYQFSQAQIGPEATPIVLYTYSGAFDKLNYVQYPGRDAATWNYAYQYYDSGSGDGRALLSPYSSPDIYTFTTQSIDNGIITVTCYLCATSSAYFRAMSKTGNSYTLSSVPSTPQIKTAYVVDDVTLFYYGSTYTATDYVSQFACPPVYTSAEAGLSSFASWLADPDSMTDTVGVKAYGNTGIADIPDTTDPNYDAVAKQLPSTVPWNDALYGDGTGALTDAQAGAIAGAADDAIVADGVLDLAGTREGTDEPGTDDPPSDDPDDYAVPGLADIFPFCIPFDIYNFLSALAAAPVAPHFTATLDFPEAVGGTQTIDIDFDSPTWNQLAQLLRLLELLAFIVGLALLTRSMFIRG